MRTALFYKVTTQTITHLKQKSCLLLFLLGFSISVIAQSLTPVGQGGVYLELNHWIYDFLQRQYIKGNLKQVYLDARPAARVELAKYVAELAEKRHQLNPVEREQVNFCLREFSDELKRLGARESRLPRLMPSTKLKLSASFHRCNRSFRTSLLRTVATCLPLNPMSSPQILILLQEARFGEAVWIHRRFNEKIG
jgi:hypothetical protein